MVGSHKRCFKISKYVVKVPRSVKDIGNMWSEQYCYLFCGRKLRKLLCPTYFIPIIPVNIQPYVKICTYGEVFKHIKRKYNRLLDRNIRFGIHIFLDIKPSNFGKYRGKVVKIDYGSSCWWYNFKVAIFGYQTNNIDMDLIKCIKNKLANKY